MSNRAVRISLTILMYLGVALFLLPYIAERTSTAAFFLIGGAVTAVVAGFLRCYLTEGGCSDRTISKPIP